MTSINGYIQGLGSGEKRTVDKRGKEIKLSVFDNIDRVIVFNEAGETSQETLTGKNLFHLTSSPITVAGVTLEQTVEGITISGSPSTYIYTNLIDETLPVGSYVIKDSKGGSSATHQLVLYKNGSTLAYITTGQRAFSVDNASDVWTVRLYVYSDNTDTIIQPQLETGSQPTSYEPYCGGVPSPNPSYPQDINGIGFRRPDGTYTVTISYDDGDEHYGTIIASGLAYPLYEGDVLDFVNGKVIRNNGRIDMGSLSYTMYSASNGNAFVVTLPNGKQISNTYNSGIKCTSYSEDTTVNNAYYIRDISCKYGGSYFGTTKFTAVDNNYNDAPSFKTAMDGQYIVYPLATPTDEYITLTGDISDIGTATVTADGTLTVTYDKAEMAIRKYSPKPDWSKIGYSDTPNAVINAFDYAKRIYDTWSFVKFTSDLNLRIFPNVDISGQLGLNAMFKNCTNLINLPPLTIGTDSGTLNASEFARASGIEEVTITSNNLNQENNFQNGFNGCSFLKNYSITAKASNVNAMFSGCSSLIEAPDFDTSTTANFSEMFSGCSSLTYVSDDFDTSSGTNFYRCFYNCSSLESIPSWDVRTGTNFQQLFAGCSSIKNVPPLNITAATNLTNMFQNSGSNLTDTSRNNILMMLATASSYTGTKTLAAVGFTSSMYSAASWQALAKYADFTAAGWSIGYS